MNQSLRWDQDGKRRYRWQGADVYVRPYASVELLQFVTVYSSARVEMPKSKRESQLNFPLIY